MTIAVARTFNTGGRGRRKYFEAMRIQFPLTSAFARTLWKVQGLTRFSTTYIDFVHKGNRKGTEYNIRHPNAHVVGISRVSDPKYLKIMNFFDDKLVWKSEVADAEMDRLRRDAQLPLTVPDLKKALGFKVVFYNMQGLKSHLIDIKSDNNLMEADILMGAETNLSSTDPDTNYQIALPHVTFYDKRFDDDSIKVGRGLIVYAKKKIAECETSRSSNGKATMESMAFKVEVLGSKLFIINIYCSPQFPVHSLRKKLSELLASIDQEENVLLMGDFNSEEQVIDDPAYTQLIEGKGQMTNNFKNPYIACYISGNTTSGMFGGKLCHAYVKGSDYYMVGEVLFKSFTRSTHHPIAVVIKNNLED